MKKFWSIFYFILTKEVSGNVQLAKDAVLRGQGLKPYALRLTPFRFSYGLLIKFSFLRQFQNLFL